MLGDRGHYLEAELQDLVRSDSGIFEFLQSAALDGLWYWDVEDPEHEWMNDAFWLTFGHDPRSKQHRADEWQSMIHPDDLEVALRNFEAHCADPSHPYDQIVRYRHKSGSTVWVRCRGMAIRDEHGRPKRMLGAHTDITSLKIVEESLRAALASNEELEQFAYVASHDLREPLRTVSAYLDLLEVKCSDELSEEARGYISVATEGARKMQRLISGLLRYSRIAAVTEAKGAVDTQAAVESALADLDALLRESGAEVEVAALPVVLGDEVQISQVFQNVLANAMKFRASDRPPCIRVRAERDETMWRFSIADNGIGIEPHAHERIFQIFQRLDTTPEGSGIGLAVVRRIVHRHGGRIWVESVPGQGSTFCFTLPAHEEEHA